MNITSDTLSGTIGGGYRSGTELMPCNQAIADCGNARIADGPGGVHRWRTVFIGGKDRAFSDFYSNRSVIDLKGSGGCNCDSGCHVCKCRCSPAKGEAKRQK